jgi:CheY-like chemotaxis protein
MLKHILEEDVSVETQMDQEFKFIEADPGQIGQIILNLAVNAKDAMPNGGKLIISTSKTSVDEKYCKARLDLQPGDYIKLSVSDTGTGMSESVKNKIFEPFFTTKESGTGLGLSTVFGIVKQNKGYIECKSEINEGSVFDIYFPIATPPGIPDAEPTESHSLPRGNETILLVEDEEDVRILTAKMLRLQGYKVIEAQDGNTALATSKKLNGNIDLLITDVIMPRMSGAELAVHLKNNQPDMQVLYISGYASSVMERQNKDINASFMQKPFTFENILYKVRDILDKSFAVET